MNATLPLSQLGRCECQKQKTKTKQKPIDSVWPACMLSMYTSLLSCGGVLHSSWDGTVVAAQCRTNSALTSCCSGGGPRQPWSSGLAPVSRFHSSFPAFPTRPRP